MKSRLSIASVLLLVACGSPIEENQVGGNDEAVAESPADFLRRSEQEMLDLNKEVGLAFWLRATYITPDTGELPRVLASGRWPSRAR